MIRKYMHLFNLETNCLRNGLISEGNHMISSIAIFALGLCAHKTFSFSMGPAASDEPARWILPLQAQASSQLAVRKAD